MPANPKCNCAGLGGIWCWADRLLSCRLRAVCDAHDRRITEQDDVARTPLDREHKSGHYVDGSNGPCWCGDIHYYAES